MHPHSHKRHLRRAAVQAATLVVALSMTCVPAATASPLTDILGQLDSGSSAPPTAPIPDGAYTVTVRFTGQMRNYPSSFVLGGWQNCVDVDNVDFDPMRRGKAEFDFVVFQDDQRCRGATSGTLTLGILLSGRDFRAGYYDVWMNSDGLGTVACAPFPEVKPNEYRIPLQCSTSGDTVTFSE